MYPYIKILILYLVKNFSIRKIFNLANFIKLLTIYVFSIFIVILLDFDFSDKFWLKLVTRKSFSQKISFYTVSERIGEKMIYDRLKLAAKARNINYCGVSFSESLTHFWLTRHLYTTATSLINLIYRPKFNLALTHHVNILPQGYNVTYLNMPRDSLYEVNGKFKSKWQHLADYDAYADLYSFVHGSNDLLDIAKNSKNSKTKNVIPVYIAQHHLEYSKPMHFDRAVITGSLWGCVRGSLRMKQALKKLGDNNLLVAYGMSDHLSFMGDAYKGPLENYGNSIDSIVKVQQKHNIALVTHNLEHMLEGIPTNRISEAAASGALIIADDHPFIRKIFGDSVLYFNSLGNYEQIFNEIKDHIEWARANPEMARFKAFEAYKIFDNSLRMEIQLYELIGQLSKK